MFYAHQQREGQEHFEWERITRSLTPLQQFGNASHILMIWRTCYNAKNKKSLKYALAMFDDTMFYQARPWIFWWQKGNDSLFHQKQSASKTNHAQYLLKWCLTMQCFSLSVKFQLLTDLSIEVVRFEHCMQLNNRLNWTYLAIMQCPISFKFSMSLA